MKTFLLRWKRRLQRRFPLAGFPDPGKHQALPAGRLLSGGFGRKMGEAPFQGVNLSRLCCLPLFWQFRERLSTWWRMSYSLITNVPGTRRPDAPLIRESRLVTKRNEAQTSREEPKERQDENFVSTAAPRPQPLHRRCTGAGFGKAARKS